MFFGVPGAPGLLSSPFSLMGVVYMAPTMALSATFWTLSSLLLLAFEAVAQEVVVYSIMEWTASV